MLIKLAWRDLCRRPVRHLLTVLMAGTAIALSVAVMLISGSLERGMTEASMPFDMIVGAAGSPSQLIFNTIFLQDTPVGNISHEIWEELEQDERVKRVIPFGFGDNYLGYRVVGSTEELFELRPSQTEPSIFQLREGRYFQEEQEAVIGATVAGELGLALGDTFQSIHGLTHDGTEEEHQEVYRVVGILEPMYRPYDKGIFVPIESVWEAHGNGGRDVTALMVTPRDYSGLYQLYQELNQEPGAQAVFPGVVMGEIFDMLGQTEDLMSLITWISMAVGLVGMAVSLSWSALGRTRENAILRAIGAGRRQVVAVVAMEGGIISLASAAVGVILGHGTALAAARYLRETSAMYSPVGIARGEWIPVTAAVAAGLVLALLPALHAYRANVVKGLAAV